jgi:hypothetical protein
MKTFLIQRRRFVLSATGISELGGPFEEGEDGFFTDNGAG